MNKSLFFFILIFLFCFRLFPQAVEKENFLFDAYYGYGTLVSLIAKAVSTTTSPVKISVLGPAGIRGEYMISDNFGFGADMQYNSFRIRWTEEQVDGFGTTNQYFYDYNWQRFRIMPKASVHFGKDENFDGYASFFGGYTHHVFKFNTNDPYYNPSVSFSGLAFRIALGGRYLFTKHFGMFGEIGFFGGALIHGGLSLKL
jgi:hypothetical protein